MAIDRQPEAEISRIVELALAEDLGEEGDITSQAIFYAGDMGAARVINREACVVSGQAVGQEICRQVDRDLAWLPLVEEGGHAPVGAEIARLDGKVLSVLAAERTLLNFLSLLSGIATVTRAFVDAIDGLGPRIAATRKTSPGMRLMEKQAVRHGGGDLHRLGLYDAVLIKDNHIATAGGVSKAVMAVRKARGEGEAIEIEVETLDQLQEALEAKVERVLLDNMSPEMVGRAVASVAGRAVVEASGGINLDNVRAYAQTGVDIISVGALTSSAAAIDLSLEMV